jgi:hypothetical protein
MAILFARIAPTVDKMDKFNIALFAGINLLSSEEITVSSVQKTIKEHPSSESIVSAEDIKDTLFLLERVGLIYSESNMEFQTVYKRYVPEPKLKQ